MKRMGNKSLLHYDECEKVTDAELRVHDIAKSHALLDILHAADAKLNFKRSDVKAGIDLAVKKVGVIDSNHRSEYTEKITKRVMNICRVVSQGMVKSMSKGKSSAMLRALVPLAQASLAFSSACTTMFVPPESVLMLLFMLAPLQLLLMLLCARSNCLFASPTVRCKSSWLCAGMGGGRCAR